MSAEGPAVVVVQARMTSSRLPGKVLLDLAGRPLLARVIERALRIPGAERVCVAVPEGAAHDPIEREVRRHPGVGCVRGPEWNVLRRTRIAAESCGAGRVVRVTSDCPLLDPGVAGAVLALLGTGASYAATAMESGYPIGLDVEALGIDALREADERARDDYEREHVTPHLWRRPERFPCAWLDRSPDRRDWRLAVDTAEDYAVVRAIYAALHAAEPEFGFAAVEALLERRPELLRANAHVQQTPYAYA